MYSQWLCEDLLSVLCLMFRTGVDPGPGIQWVLTKQKTPDGIAIRLTTIMPSSLTHTVSTLFFGFFPFVGSRRALTALRVLAPESQKFVSKPPIDDRVVNSYIMRRTERQKTKSTAHPGILPRRG